MDQFLLKITKQRRNCFFFIDEFTMKIMDSEV